MSQNIKNNNVRKISMQIKYDQYYDFMLYKGETTPLPRPNVPVSEIKFTNKIENKIFYSDKIWDKAINSGITLKNIGFTGVDNGQIVYRKDRISNTEFLEIYTKSKLNLPEGDLRFFLRPVSGNTLEYVYPIEYNENYVSLKGGFFQGFFKLHEKEYQVLPSEIEDAWSFNIRLRPRKEYGETNETLNYYIPDNEGFIFYIGTRAENKFWPLYGSDLDKMKEFYDNGCLSEEYCQDFNIGHNIVTDEIYVTREDPNDTYNMGCSPVRTPRYYLDDYFTPEKDPACYILDNFFGDGYAGANRETCEPLLKDYLGEDTDLNEVELKTDEGYDLNQRKRYRFTTDNKFLLFNHTPTGFTTNNWVEGTEVEFEHFQEHPNINLFEKMNRTPTGVTVDNVDELYKKETYSYKVMKDLYNNAFGVKINKDGSLSYRYLVLDCENQPNHFRIEEETTSPGIVKDNVWQDITITLNKLDDSHMSVELRVDEKLKFVSKDLPILKLRALNETNEKQETVPYNISVGGGSQGLAEAIYLDYYNQLDYTLPIERYFGGSFIGDLSSFSFEV